MKKRGEQDIRKGGVGEGVVSVFDYRNLRPLLLGCCCHCRRRWSRNDDDVRSCSCRSFYYPLDCCCLHRVKAARSRIDSACPKLPRPSICEAAATAAANAHGSQKWRHICVSKRIKCSEHTVIPTNKKKEEESPRTMGTHTHSAVPFVCHRFERLSYLSLTINGQDGAREKGERISPFYPAPSGTHAGLRVSNHPTVETDWRPLLHPIFFPQSSKNIMYNKKEETRSSAGLQPLRYADTVEILISSVS